MLVIYIKRKPLTSSVFYLHYLLHPTVPRAHFRCGHKQVQILQERSVDPSKREKTVIGDIGDFHNSDFHFTFEDMMMFDLQNLHDDFQIQIQPLTHQHFDNMR